MARATGAIVSRSSHRVESRRRAGAMPVPLVGMLVGLLTACASYSPAPLPDDAILAAPPAPDIQRLRLAAAELDHPRLEPVVLDLSDGLSPGEAAVLAVLANPDLEAARDRHGEAAAQLVGAGMLPNPVLSMQSEQPYGAGSAGAVSLETESLEMPLDELVTRSARVAAASRQLAAVDLGIAWSEWQVAQRARLAAQRVGWLERRVGLVDNELAVEEGTAAALEQAMEQGDETLQNVGVQRAAVAALRASRDDLARSVTEARGDLSVLLGLPQGFPLDVTDPGAAEDQEWAELPSADTLVGRALGSRLDLAALRSGYDAQEETVRAAVLAQFPALSVGQSWERNEGALKFLGGFVTLALPFFDRNQAAIVGERATRTRLRDEYVARVAGIRAQLSTLLEMDALLAEQIEEGRATVERLAEVEHGERAAVRSGDVDRLTYQTVRSAFSDARLRLAALAQQRVEIRTALETEAGALLER